MTDASLPSIELLKEYREGVFLRAMREPFSFGLGTVHICQCG